jgi:hypothetical protein
VNVFPGSFRVYDVDKKFYNVLIKVVDVILLSLPLLLSFAYFFVAF